MAQVESGIGLLVGLADRARTTALLALPAADLEDGLDGWSPRRGLPAAADRRLGTAVRRAVRVLRREVADASGAGDGGPTSSPGAQLRTGILHAHHLLRALAIEAAAFAADLDADPLDAALHTQADRCRTDLATLIEGITRDPLIILNPPIALTEPSDEYVAALAARCRPKEGADDAAW